MPRANDAARRPASPAPPASAETPGTAPTLSPAPLPVLPPPVPARARRGRLSSKFGTVNYSVDEMRRLNDKVRAVLPVSADEWLHVAYQFNYMRPDSIPYREVDSLKRKFKKMYCARGSGGHGNTSNGGADAALPEYLVEAKALRQLINQRSDKAQSEDAQSDLGAAGEDHRDHGDGGGDGSSSQAGAEDDAGQSAAVGGADATSDAPAASAQAADSEGRPTTLLADALRDDSAGGDALAVERAEPHELRHVRTLDGSTERQQQQPPRALGLPVDGLAHAGGGLASRLRFLEEDLQRSGVPAAGSGSGSGQAQRGREASESLAATGAADSTASAPSSPTAASVANAHQALMPPGVPLSTTGIISMLKHSIERKRRSVEEQALHESARVRKERKKRKMELALFSIHQEQRERAASSGASALGAAATLPAGSDVRLPPSPSRPSSAGASAGLNHPLFQSPAFSTALSGASDASTLGLMDIMLQYMTAQQLEAARRYEQEEERRRREELARAERRRVKDQQRRRQHQELMLALQALLGDKFPPSLRHLVDRAPSGPVDEREAAEAPPSSSSSSVEDSASVLL